MEKYTQDIRYSLLHVPAVERYLQEETPNTILRHNRASFYTQSNPAITTSVYTTPHLQRQTFCDTN